MKKRLLCAASACLMAAVAASSAGEGERAAAFGHRGDRTRERRRPAVAVAQRQAGLRRRHARPDRHAGRSGGQGRRRPDRLGRQRFDFIKGDAPATVNPSLWRQEQLNNAQGLFKVTDGIYQIRGFDIANMTLVEGKTGWIVIDPLLTARDRAGRAGARDGQAGQQQAGGRGDLHPQPCRPLRRRARRRRRGRRARRQGQGHRARRASWTTPSPRTCSPAMR